MALARMPQPPHERDATDPEQVATLLAEADPDVIVVAAGTRPRMAAIDQQTWESFSAPWNVDVKIAVEVGRRAGPTAAPRHDRRDRVQRRRPVFLNAQAAAHTTPSTASRARQAPW
jgi:hypothetical protein